MERKLYDAAQFGCVRNKEDEGERMKNNEGEELFLLLVDFGPLLQGLLIHVVVPPQQRLLPAIHEIPRRGTGWLFSNPAQDESESKSKNKNKKRAT